MNQQQQWQQQQHHRRRRRNSSVNKATLVPCRSLFFPSKKIVILLGGVLLYSSLQVVLYYKTSPSSTGMIANNGDGGGGAAAAATTTSSLFASLKATNRHEKDGGHDRNFHTNSTTTTDAIMTTSATSTIRPRPSSSTSKTRRQYAYCFLIAGVNPNKVVTYRNYLIHVFVATYTLRQHHTRADIVLMIQLSAYTAENETELFPTTDTVDAGHDSHDSNNNVGGVMTTKETFRALLEELNIQVHYTTFKPLRDNFYTAQLAKFDILTLTQYDRVLYMDADVLPLCNLDYLFEATTTSKPALSPPSLQIPSSQELPSLQLKPNVILSWFNEPSHGGFFILQPSKPNYDAIQSIIDQREAQAINLPPPQYWDPIVGWGHTISKDDPWHGLPSWKPPSSSSSYPPIYHATSTNWTFHGDFADQGLLYYYTKYYLQNVSILFLDHVEQWGNGGGDVTRATHLEDVHYVTTGRFKEEMTTSDVGGKQKQQKQKQQQRRKSLYYFPGCLPPKMEYPGHYGSSMHPLLYDHVPHRDFVHFSGSSKPWEQPEPTSIPSSIDQITSSIDYWWYQLHQLKQTYRNLTMATSTKDGRRKKIINLDSIQVDSHQRPNLGRYPTYRSMIGTIQKKLKKQKQQKQQQQQQQQQKHSNTR